MKKSKFLTVILCLSGLIAMGIGTIVQISPLDFYSANNIDIGSNINLFSEIRASSGFLLTSGILILTGAFVSQLTFTSIMFATVLYLSYGLSRFASMTIDGMPVNSLIQAALIEITIGLFCLFSLWRYLHSEFGN
ncbi:MAG: DUF4345 domain-containing protein [Pleurocapsa sp. MO_226.B13]|nr:DUF4345 domain-containing protein [Pleurocapsa sp. MO_226.B13]